MAYPSEILAAFERADSEREVFPQYLVRSESGKVLKVFRGISQWEAAKNFAGDLSIETIEEEDLDF